MAVGCQEQQGLEQVWTALFLTLEQQVTSGVSDQVTCVSTPAACSLPLCTSASVLPRQDCWSLGNL